MKSHQSMRRTSCPVERTTIKPSMSCGLNESLACCVPSRRRGGVHQEAATLNELRACCFLSRKPYNVSPAEGRRLNKLQALLGRTTSRPHHLRPACSWCINTRAVAQSLDLCIGSRSHRKLFENQSGAAESGCSLCRCSTSVQARTRNMGRAKITCGEK